MVGATCDVLTDIRLEIGEGPVWDHRTSRVLLVDIPAGELYRVALDGTTSVEGLGRPIGAVGLRREAELIVGTETGIAMYDGQALSDFSSLRLDPTVRMNDCQVGPDGCLWAGSMAWDASQGAGSVYRIAPSGAWDVAISGVSISNGIGWSADARTMYYVDSSTQALEAFDFHDGEVSNRRHVINFDAGLPDGLCVDEEDHVWVAVYGAGAVHRISPGGTLVGSVRVPATLTTSCCFAGEDLDVLVVTSAAASLSPLKRHQERAGAVFVADVGVKGRRAHEFG